MEGKHIYEIVSFTDLETIREAWNWILSFVYILYKICSKYSDGHTIM